MTVRRDTLRPIALVGTEGACSANGKTVPLLKLALEMGPLREEPDIRSSGRGSSREIPPHEIEHPVALAPEVLGFPSAGAAHTWIRESIEESRAR